MSNKENTKNRWFTLDEKSLHQQRLFWICLITPFVVGFIIGLPVWFKYELAFNYQAYDFFMQISKLPLSIMALSPIATAFVVNAHKTIQTSKQINLLTRKNTQDEFYSHYKYMIETISSLTMTVYVISNDDFSDVSIAKGSEVDLPINTPKFTFLCGKPQRIYSFVFDKCSPQRGVSFDRNTVIIDSFNENIKKLALFCLFNEHQENRNISTNECIDIIRRTGGSSLSQHHFNSMMFFITDIMDMLNIESDSIVGMDMDVFMAKMDNKSMTVFAMEVLKLYSNVINYLYEDLGSDFLSHKVLAFHVIALFQRAASCKHIKMPVFN